MTFTQNVILWALVFVLIGASSYITDRKIGVKIYGKIRKWWHPPSEQLVQVERGFIYNRSNKVRWQWAAFVATFQAAIMIGFRHEDPRVELMLIFVITPATFLGFMIGPYYEKFKKLREKGFEKMDQVESGQIDIGDEVRDAFEKKKKSAGALLVSFKDKILKRVSDTFPYGKAPVRANAPAAASAASSPGATTQTAEDEDAEAAKRALERVRKLGKQ